MFSLLMSEVVNVLVLRPGDSNFCALSESALSAPELVGEKETGEQSGAGDRGAERGRGPTG